MLLAAPASDVTMGLLENPLFRRLNCMSWSYQARDSSCRLKTFPHVRVKITPDPVQPFEKLLGPDSISVHTRCCNILTTSLCRLLELQPKPRRQACAKPCAKPGQAFVLPRAAQSDDPASASRSHANQPYLFACRRRLTIGTS